MGNRLDLLSEQVYKVRYVWVGVAAMREQAELIQLWRERADSYDIAASGYNRRCIAVKGVQLQLRAKEVRKCAEELEKLNAQGANAQAQDRNTPNPEELSLAVEALAEEQLEPKAP